MAYGSLIHSIKQKTLRGRSTARARNLHHTPSSPTHSRDQRGRAAETMSSSSRPVNRPYHRCRIDNAHASFCDEALQFYNSQDLRSLSLSTSQSDLSICGSSQSQREFCQTPSPTKRPDLLPNMGLPPWIVNYHTLNTDIQKPEIVTPGLPPVPAADASSTNHIIARFHDSGTICEAPSELIKTFRALGAIPTTFGRDTCHFYYKPSDLTPLRSVVGVANVDIYHRHLKIDKIRGAFHDPRRPESPRNSKDGQFLHLSLYLHDYTFSKDEFLRKCGERGYLRGTPDEDLCVIGNLVYIRVPLEDFDTLLAEDCVKIVAKTVRRPAQLAAGLSPAPFASDDGELQPNLSGNIDVDGTDVVIASSDSGFDKGSRNPNNLHEVFTPAKIRQLCRFGRASNIPDEVKDLLDHGTGCLSCAVGTRGTAPGASFIADRIFEQKESTISEDTLYNVLHAPMAYGAHVFSESWCTPLQDWEIRDWYSDFALTIDQLSYENPDRPIFWAVGNYHFAPRADWNSSSEIAGQALAKNVLSVGSCDPDGQVSNFSSRRKPSEPGRRIAPQVITLGRGIKVARTSLTRQGYMWQEGTSYSTPKVAGHAAVLIQALRNRGVSPCAALIYALLVNGAEPLVANQQAPSLDSGFGRVSIHASLVHCRPPNNFAGFEQCSFQEAMNREPGACHVLLPGKMYRLRTTLVWTDRSGPELEHQFWLEAIFNHADGRQDIRLGNDTNVPDRRNSFQRVHWPQIAAGTLKIRVRTAQAQGDFPTDDRNRLALVWLLEETGFEDPARK